MDQVEKRWEGDERRGGVCPSPGCRLPEAAADSAVRKVFAILGVDIDDPQQVQRFQDQLRFTAKLQDVFDKGFFGVLAAAASIATAAVIAKLFGWR